MFRYITLAFAALMLATPASAQDGVVLPLQTCTTANCSPVNIPARLNGNGTSSETWVMTFLATTAAADTCLRFAVINASVNLEMSVVTPDGRVFTNDNVGSGTCTHCPRVVISSIGDKGYFTVVINHRLGQSMEGGFALRAGQYKSLSNPNCASPTPLATTKSATRKAVKMRAAAIKQQ